MTDDTTTRLNPPRRARMDDRTVTTYESAEPADAGPPWDTYGESGDPAHHNGHRPVPPRHGAPVDDRSTSRPRSTATRAHGSTSAPAAEPGAPDAHAGAPAAEPAAAVAGAARSDATPASDQPNPAPAAERTYRWVYAHRCPLATALGVVVGTWNSIRATIELIDWAFSPAHATTLQFALLLSAAMWTLAVVGVRQNHLKTAPTVFRSMWAVVALTSTLDVLSGLLVGTDVVSIVLAASWPVVAVVPYLVYKRTLLSALDAVRPRSAPRRGPGGSQLPVRRRNGTKNSAAAGK